MELYILKRNKIERINYDDLRLLDITEKLREEIRETEVEAGNIEIFGKAHRVFDLVQEVFDNIQVNINLLAKLKREYNIDLEGECERHNAKLMGRSWETAGTIEITIK
jgi:thiamine phosphate synthase YjbQ (UPF0047 family)